MSGNKQSGMKEKTAENTKKRGNTEMKTELQKQLFTLQDPGYREFHARLIPGIPLCLFPGIHDDTPQFA